MQFKVTRSHYLFEEYAKDNYFARFDIVAIITAAEKCTLVYIVDIPTEELKDGRMEI